MDRRENERQRQGEINDAFLSFEIASRRLKNGTA